MKNGGIFETITSKISKSNFIFQFCIVHIYMVMNNIRNEINSEACEKAIIDNMVLPK